MNDDLSDPRQEYERATKSLSTLRAMLKAAGEGKQKRYLEKEIDRLTLFREQLVASFEMDPVEGEGSQADAAAAQPKQTGPAYPILESIRERFKDYPQVAKSSDPEMRDVASYLFFFEEEYLPLYDKRKLDLDHVNGMELDTFYEPFAQIKRRIEIFTTETEAIYVEKGPKTLKRLKTKQGLLVEIFSFFHKLDKFSLSLIADIEGDQAHCFNGNTKVHFGPHEQRLTLVGKTVRASLLAVDAFAREIMDYLDIPTFKKSM